MLYVTRSPTPNGRIKPPYRTSLRRINKQDTACTAINVGIVAAGISVLRDRMLVIWYIRISIIALGVTVLSRDYIDRARGFEVR
ncbi:hypothetical protein K474DRAFT_1665633 [Panus rudis PR-1116 ss-1]|nr:hypothetical protein K474DRAFT_1665633 [Panus rudis PR-1116 ss-1]